MEKQKLHSTKKYQNPIYNIQVQKSNATGETSLLNDEDLKRYHDIYVKLNKLYASDNVIYYITEEDLKNIDDSNPQVHIRLKEKKSKIKVHDKVQIEETKKENMELLETILAELNDSDNFKIQKIKEHKRSKHKNHEHKPHENKVEPPTIDIESLPKRDINYDIEDMEEYDTFIIKNENGKESYYGMPSKSIQSYALINNKFIGKMLNYKLNDETSAYFLVYSTKWPQYTYPIYVIIHDCTLTTKRFITIFNSIIGLIT
jgi:hypothetical protein